MKKIYIVRGCCGAYAYEDCMDWTVKAYLDESQAEQHCKDANSWCIENKCSLIGDSTQKYDNPFDPYMSSDVLGTQYYLEEVELG